MQNPGSCCFGASPSRLLPPALHQTSRLRGGTGREHRQRHLAWLHALLTLLQGPGRAPSTSVPQPSHLQGLAAPCWVPWVIILAAAGLTPMPEAPRGAGTSRTAPPAPAHPTESTVGGVLCQATRDPTEGKDGGSKAKTTRAALMPRGVRMDVRGRDAVLGRKGTPLGTGQTGTEAA